MEHLCDQRIAENADLQSEPGSIDAVMHPAKTKNLYFISDGYGGLRFAKELDEHNKNVRLFRKVQRETGARGS